MNLNRLLTILLLLLSIGLISITSARAELIEGKNYTVLPTPQPIQDNGAIEVIEFFWYGCSHCNHLHPHLKIWLQSIPDDVNFRYVPAIFRTNWVPAAKTFYAIEAMGIKDALHDKIYDAIHLKKINLTKEPVLFSWIEKQGIEREKFVSAYNSFTVQNQVARSTQMTRQYKLSGVPSLVVGGKYLTSGGMNKTPQDTIKVLEKLIDKVRKEKASQ
tara:strand:+ start:3012 stop:3659 length:648 start_codon:yes stop_codon:yes gene_type:complete